MSEQQPTISNLESNGRGWRWDVTVTEWDAFLGRDVRRTYHFHTNTEGNGLWNGDQQIEGTAQFSLPADRTRALRAIRYRYRWTGR